MLGPSDKAASGCGMHFHEKSVAAGSRRGAGQRRDEFTLAAGCGAASPGELHAVGRVEDDGIAEAPHDREGPHVHDEIVVSEG